MRNFHVPLPDHAHSELREFALRARIPATTLAREAIEAWLREAKRRQRDAEITKYAEEMAGTTQDLDPALEAAGVEHLLGTTKAPR